MKSLFVLLFIQITIAGFSQPATDSLTGTWRGNSICQVKNSPCRDEVAVYHISKTEKPGIYKFIMNKMVNGMEEEMGVTEFNYDPIRKIFTSKNEQRQILWKFTLMDNKMDGTLFYKGEIYRVIKLSRE